VTSLEERESGQVCRLPRLTRRQRVFRAPDWARRFNAHRSAFPGLVPAVLFVHSLVAQVAARKLTITTMGTGRDCDARAGENSINFATICRLDALFLDEIATSSWTSLEYDPAGYRVRPDLSPSPQSSMLGAIH
jgi:hypothetical protein